MKKGRSKKSSAANFAPPTTLAILVAATALCTTQVAATCYTEGYELFPIITSRSYSTTSTSSAEGSVLNMRSCTDSAGKIYMAVLHNMDLSSSSWADNRINLAIYDQTDGTEGFDAQTATVQTYNGSWDSTYPDTALFFDNDCSAVAWGFYSETGTFRFLRHDLPIDCTYGWDTDCYSTMQLHPYQYSNYSNMRQLSNEAFQFETNNDNMLIVRNDEDNNYQSYAFETEQICGVMSHPATQDDLNISTWTGVTTSSYYEQRKNYIVYSSVMVSSTHLIWAGVTYDTAVFAGFNLASGTDARYTEFEQAITIGYPVSDVGVTKPMVLRKFRDSSDQLFIYVAYVNTEGFSIVRWQASEYSGLTDNAYHKGLTGAFEDGDDEILDVYITSFDEVTVMMSEAKYSDRSSVKIWQFDYANELVRSRSVAIFGSSSDSYVGVSSGTLTGTNKGYFGGVSIQLGYQNSAADTCSASTILFKYPQLYGGTSSASSYEFGFVQSITAGDSCLPFDDSYGDWEETDLGEEQGSLYTPGSPNESTEYKTLYPYDITNEDQWLLIPYDDFTNDMAWCPYEEDVTLTSSFTDQTWTVAESFTYTFSDWSESPTCSDLRLTYNLVGFYRKSVTDTDWVDASNFLTYSGTNTISSTGNVQAYDDEFRVDMEAVVNDGKCTFSSFYITNPCAANSLSLSGNGVADQTYYIGDSSVSATLDTYTASTVSTSTCTLTYTYYVYDYTYNEWVLQSSNSSPFTAFDTTTGELTWYLASGSSTSITVKLVATDLVSQVGDASSHEDTFELTIIDPCTENSLTEGTTIEDVLYYVTDSSQTVSMDVSGADGACTITFALYFYDEPNYDWILYSTSNAGTYNFVSSFSSSSGSLSLYTTDYGSYSDFTIRTKIVATGADSVEDEFDITIKDQCRDVYVSSGLSGFTGTEASPYQWDMFQTQSVTFSPVVQGGASGCPMVYRLTEDNAERTDGPLGIYSISDSVSYLTLSGVWPYGTVSTRYYYVRTEIYDMQYSDIVATTEVQYWIEVSNPCLTSGSITSQTISDNDYWIGDGGQTVGFSDFSDYASTTYSYYGPNLCGPKEYYVYASDQFTPYSADNYPTVTDYLTYSSSSGTHYLTVSTSDVDLYTNEWIYFYLQVRLTDYYAAYPQYAIHYEEFRVRLKNCMVNDFTFDAVADQSYNVYTPVYWVPVPEFTQVPEDTTFTKSSLLQCGYTVTYTATRRDFYDDIEALPSFIEWNESNRRFEIYSEDPDDADHTTVFYYKIQLTATISSSLQYLGYTETLEFDLYVDNGCLLDQITAETTIADYIYYLAEDTTTPDFDEGLSKPMDKQYALTWDQTVDGCPVDYTIYVTVTDEDDVDVRTAVDSFESAVISYISTEQINVLIPWDQQDTTFDPFDGVVRVQNSDIDSYDLEQWNVSIVMASTQSTSASREGITDFVLDLRDVCWDLPLSEPSLAAGNSAPSDWHETQVTDLWFEALQFDDNTFSISAMNTQWGDYCDGFFYTIIYVDGDIEEVPDDDTMLDVFSASGTTVTVTTDLTWVGIHTLQIRGQNGAGDKQYKTIDSVEFTVEFIHPCTISTVTQVDLEGMVTTVLVGEDVTQVFYNPSDSQSLKYADEDGYTLCGDRFVYVQLVDEATTLVDEPWSYIMPFLQLNTYETTPGEVKMQSPDTSFQFVVNAESQVYWDEYSLTLTVELADWPTSTPSTTDFKVTINPCEVTSFEAPGDLNITYPLNVNSTLMTVEYNFAQAPCSYEGTYSAKFTNGTLEMYDLFPTFITVYEDQPVMTIYSANLTHEGNYTVEVCHELDYRYIWDNFDGVWETLDDDSLIWDADNPPEDLLYVDCFNIYVWMNSTEPDPIDVEELEELIKDYVPPENSAPVMIVKPKDMAIYAGSELVVEFGEPFDVDGDLVYVGLDLDRADSFATYDANSRILQIPEGATTNSTAGRYNMKLTVQDPAGLSTSYGFVIYIRYRPANLKADVAQKSQVVVTADQIYPILTADDLVIEEDVTTPTFDDLAKNVDAILQDSDSATGVGGGSQKTFVDRSLGFVSSDEGEVVVNFSERLIVPQGFQNIDSREVAFDPRRRRLSESRVETLLTDTGYVDFVIRPALEVSIAEEDSGNVRDIDFTWEITDFTPDNVKIKMNFADPTQVSETEPDDLVLTFWQGDLFIVEATGKPLPNGFKIKTELPPQYVEAAWDDYSDQGERVGLLLLLVFCIGLVMTAVCQGSFIPVYGLFETIQMISHLPLVNATIPTRLISFLRPINDMVRFNFEGNSNVYFRDEVGVDNMESDYLNRRFREFGYDGTIFLSNTIQIFVVLAGALVFCAFLLFLEFMLNRLDRGFNKKLLPQLISGFFRLLMLTFFELILCIWIHFHSYFRVEENGDFLTSYWFALLTSVGLGVILFFACVQTCPQQAKCGPSCNTFFLDLNPDHPRRSALYPAYLLFRRVAMVAVLGYLRDHPLIQLSILLIVSCGMMIVIVGKQPFENKDHTFLQFFNEMNIFLLTGLLIAFTKLTFNTDKEVGDIVSFIFMVDILLITVVNGLFILHSSIFGALHAHRVNKREKAIKLWKSQNMRHKKFMRDDVDSDFTTRGFVLQDKSNRDDILVENHNNLADIVEEYDSEVEDTPRLQNNIQPVNQILLDLHSDEGEDDAAAYKAEELGQSQIILLPKNNDMLDTPEKDPQEKGNSGPRSAAVENEKLDLEQEPISAKGSIVNDKSIDSEVKRYSSELAPESKDLNNTMTTPALKAALEPTPQPTPEPKKKVPKVNLAKAVAVNAKDQQKASKFVGGGGSKRQVQTPDKNSSLFKPFKAESIKVTKIEDQNKSNMVGMKGKFGETFQQPRMSAHQPLSEELDVKGGEQDKEAAAEDLLKQMQAAQQEGNYGDASHPINFNPNKEFESSRLSGRNGNSTSRENSTERRNFAVQGQEVIRASDPIRSLKTFKPIKPIPKRAAPIKIKPPAKPIPSIKDAYFGSKPVEQPKVRSLGANVGGFRPKKVKKAKVQGGNQQASAESIEEDGPLPDEEEKSSISLM